VSPLDLSALVDEIAEAVAAKIVARLAQITTPASAPIDEPESIDTAAAGKIVGLSSQYLKLLRVKGGGPRYTKIGRSVRYLRRDLESFRAAHMRKHTSERS
jgi:hypothetical protein